jgi:hypothetical protein
MQLANVKITTREDGTYAILIDEEPIDMMVSGVEVKISHDHAEVTFVVPLESVELDLDNAELTMKVTTEDDGGGV